jgi:hypothetical protein
MGSHHKRFGSARTARCVHTLDLVRAPPRVWQAGVAWKGGQQFGWVIHDCIQIHINMALNRLESISGLCVPRSDAPKRDWASEHRILLQEVRCRPPKFDSRFPAPLTQDGDAPGTQESHPSATPPTSTRNAWPCFGWWLVNTPSLGQGGLTAARRSSRAAWASLGEPPEWLGHLRHVPTAQEPELGILGPRRQPP